jgi:flagellar hook assembly protein FlgD
LRSLRLQVWDNANNPSEIEFTLDIVESGTVSLDKVYNYPNPMRDETWFTCQTPVSNGRIIVDIFSVSGRKLNTVEEQIMRPGFQKIYWDGRDSRGNRLAIGTYLYRLTLESGGEKRKKTEKLVILR